MRTPLIVTGVITAIALTGSGCADRDPATPGAAPPAKPAAATPHTPAAIGTTQKVTGADVDIAATVYHVRNVKSRAEFGNRSKTFIGVDARVCFTKTTEASSVGTMPWSIIYADDTGAQPIGEYWTGEFPVPTYPEGRKLASGQCARGWIMFTPLKGTPVRVTYGPDDGTPVSWRMS
jgi:hypothetical protein